MEVSLRLPFSHPCGLILSSASRVQACTPTVDRLGGTNVHCDKGHTGVTRATATGAEDVAIPSTHPVRGAIKDPGGRGQVAVELELSRSYHGPPGEPQQKYHIPKGKGVIDDRL